MDKYSVINLKTDPELKKRAMKAAAKLGVSISAVLNNELRRFATEQSVVFELPEAPNAETAKQLEAAEREEGYRFAGNVQALEFLADELA